MHPVSRSAARLGSSRHMSATVYLCKLEADREILECWLPGLGRFLLGLDTLWTSHAVGVATAPFDGEC